MRRDGGNVHKRSSVFCPVANVLIGGGRMQKISRGDCYLIGVSLRHQAKPYWAGAV